MRIMLFVSALLLAAGCGAGSYDKAENAQDAGREFIRASLDGDYRKAKFYMLQDTTNLMMIRQQQLNYEQLSPAERTERRGSNIRPISISAINDSVTVYTYYNTYNTKDTTAMTVLKTGSDWVVDLKTILRH
jgi:hypothetical protein